MVLLVPPPILGRGGQDPIEMVLLHYSSPRVKFGEEMLACSGFLQEPVLDRKSFRLSGLVLSLIMQVFWGGGRGTKMVRSSFDFSYL